MRSNAWTTQEEYDFLTSLIPTFTSHQGIRDIAPFLTATADDFLIKFPARSPEYDREQMTKVRFCLIYLYLFIPLYLQYPRSYARGMATIPGRLSRVQMLAKRSTSQDAPTADPFPCRSHRPIPQFITARVLISSSRLETFMSGTHAEIPPRSYITNIFFQDPNLWRKLYWPRKSLPGWRRRFRRPQMSLLKQRSRFRWPRKSLLTLTANPHRRPPPIISLSTSTSNKHSFARRSR